MSKDRLENQIQEIYNKRGLDGLISHLRLVSANEKSEKILNLIRSAIQLCQKIQCQESIVNLLELEIKQLFYKNNSTEKINSLLSEMFRISEGSSYEDGLILAHSIEWGIRKLEGRTKESKNTLEKAKLLLTQRNKRTITFTICVSTHLHLMIGF